MAQEAFVQMPPDGAGKKIRNRQDDIPQSDGTTATVETQVVTLAECDRRLLESIERNGRRLLAAGLLLLEVADPTGEKLNAIDQLAETL